MKMHLNWVHSTGKYAEEYLKKIGVFRESDVPKGEMLALILKDAPINLYAFREYDLKKFFSNFSYTKSGEYYELNYHGVDYYIESGIRNKIFRSDGSMVEGYNIDSYMVGRDLKVHNRSSIGEEDSDRIDSIIGQIKEEQGKRITRVNFIDNNVAFIYRNEQGNEERIFYLRDENGELSPCPKESKRLMDDIGEQDIIRSKKDSVANSLIGHTEKRAREIVESYSMDQRTLTDLFILYRDVLISRGKYVADIVLNEIDGLFFDESWEDSKFSKSEMLESLFRKCLYIKTFEEDRVYYQDVGDYYICGYDTPEEDEIGDYYRLEHGVLGCFSKDGKEVTLNSVKFENNGGLTYEIKSNNKEVPRGLLDDIDTLVRAKKTDRANVFVLDSNVMINMLSNGNVETEMYRQNEKGELERVDIGVRRRIMDDMSALDIQLMEGMNVACITKDDMVVMAEKTTGQIDLGYKELPDSDEFRV